MARLSVDIKGKAVQPFFYRIGRAVVERKRKVCRFVRTNGSDEFHQIVSRKFRLRLGEGINVAGVIRGAFPKKIERVRRGGFFLFIMLFGRSELGGHVFPSPVSVMKDLAGENAVWHLQLTTVFCGIHQSHIHHAVLQADALCLLDFFRKAGRAESHGVRLLLLDGTGCFVALLCLVSAARQAEEAQEHP